MSADRRALYAARDTAAARVASLKEDLQQAQGDLLRTEMALRDASPVLAHVGDRLTVCEGCGLGGEHLHEAVGA